jgi:hypothetical protein
LQSTTTFAIELYGHENSTRKFEKAKKRKKKKENTNRKHPVTMLGVVVVLMVGVTVRMWVGWRWN